jgi:hypothetical protein
MAELRRGLDVFGRRCDEQLRGLHEHLSKFLDSTLAKMAPVIGPLDATAEN